LIRSGYGRFSQKQPGLRKIKRNHKREKIRAEPIFVIGEGGDKISQKKSDGGVTNPNNHQPLGKDSGYLPVPKGGKRGKSLWARPAGLQRMPD